VGYGDLEFWSTGAFIDLNWLHAGKGAVKRYGGDAVQTWRSAARGGKSDQEMTRPALGAPYTSRVQCRLVRSNMMGSREEKL